jgi:hypothetical protein
MVDNRDKYQRKVPPLAVRAQTAPSIEDSRRAAQLRAEAAELDGGAVPMHEITDFESETPPPIRTASDVVQLHYRQRRASVQIDNLRLTVTQVASDVGHLAERMDSTKAAVQAIDVKFDSILKAELDDKRTREARNETARLDLERARLAAETEERKAERERRAQEQRDENAVRRSGAAYKTKVALAIIAAIGAPLATYLIGRGGAP